MVGMGKELCGSDERAREIFERVDKALGISLSSLCFEGPIEKLTLTEFAQPAILTTSIASFACLPLPLTAGAGHSLGEYSALVAAGSLLLEDAVCIVHKRGRYMQEAVKPGMGKMVAVMGPKEEEIASTLSSIDTGIAEIANLNCPGQTVIAGDVAGIDLASEKLKENGAKIIPLMVSAPFHCSLMKPAAEKLWADLDRTTFKCPAFPIYANVTAKAVTSASEARELLKRQVCAPVRWTESMSQMIADCRIDITVEFGPGGVLTKLLKRIDKNPTSYQAFDPESISAVSNALVG